MMWPSKHGGHLDVVGILQKLCKRSVAGSNRTVQEQQRSMSRAHESHRQLLYNAPTHSRFVVYK